MARYFNALTASLLIGAGALSACSNPSAPTGLRNETVAETGDANSLPNDEFTIENVTTTSNDWKKADVIFPKGTRIVKFHLEDLYARSCDRDVHVVPSTASWGSGFDTYVYPDWCADVPYRRPNRVYYIGGFEFGVNSGLRNGDVFTLRIKVDREKTGDRSGFKGLNGLIHIESPGGRYYRGSNTVEFKVGLNQSKTITFAVAK